MKLKAMKEVTFKISRYKTDIIDPARFYTYKVVADDHLSVLDGLEQVRLQQEPTLVYRHSCHHSSCGTCACIINGSERLACTTKVLDLNSTVITLEPLSGFERIADLAVKVEPFFEQIHPGWTYLQPAETIGDPYADAPADPFYRFENCIECGSCVSACPVSQDEEKFMGPAALAAIHREILKSPAKKKELLKLAGGKRGERWCQRALACSRVCPTKVYPARHIADLRRALKRQ